MTNPRYPSMACADVSQDHGEASPSEYAWIVSFSNGNSNNDHRNNNNRVRAVRGPSREFQGVEDTVSFRALHSAWKQARRNKAPSASQLDFDTQWGDGLLDLQDELNTGIWSPHPTDCFIATRPKAREIHAPAFRDRIVHHLILPPLVEERHLVEAKSRASGQLFDLPAMTLPEQRDEKKRTVRERCDRVAQLVDTGQPALVWCQLNEEADLLESIIPGAVQVAGQHSDAVKEARFMDFIDGNIRVLVTKPKIGALGLNFQHCAHVVDFPSHSYEQWYQGIRRCYRFGQTKSVKVDTVYTEGESRIIENRQRKAAQAESMFANLVAEMNHAISVNTSKSFNKSMEAPRWAA